MAKRQYSDEDKAAALLALEANGNVVAKTAKETGIPANTIRAWRDGVGTPPSVTNIRDEKRPELIDRFMNELHSVLDLMPDKRIEASYSDLARAAGIYTDKVQLLSGKPTERTEHNVTVDDFADLFRSMGDYERKQRNGKPQD